MRSHLLMVFCILVVFCVEAPANENAEKDSKQQVRSALAELEGWFGASTNGNGWRKYLKLQKLHVSLEADTCNIADLLEVQSQLHSKAAGLEMKRFVRLRKSLDSWLQSARRSKENIAKYLESTIPEFQTATEVAMTQVKANLQRSVDQLQAFLDPAGEHGAGWKKFLRFDAMQKELQSENPSGENLYQIASLYHGDHSGLEHRRFVAVRKALDEYLITWQCSLAETRELYTEQMKRLVDLVGQYTAKPSADVQSQIREIVNWADRLGQAPESVQQIREHFSQKNMHFRVSAKVVGTMIQREVDQELPVVDNILGAEITGQGRTIGKVTGKLVPNEERAVIHAVFKGENNADTVGHKGPAEIFSKSRTQLSAYKQIIMDRNGLRVHPTRSEAVTSTEFQQINSCSRFFPKLVHRIVVRKAYEQKSLAECIAAQHAEEIFNGRMDAESQELLELAVEAVSNFRENMIEQDLYPEEMQFSTSDSDLMLTIRQGNAGQLASSSGPPADAGESDMSLRLHCSMANNLMATMLGGQVVSRREFKDLVTELVGKVADDPEDVGEWSITFDPTRPVTFDFDGDTVSITIRSSNYTFQNKQVDTRDMDIVATYRIVAKGGGMHGTLVGDLKIGPDNPNVRQTTTKKIMEKHLTHLFTKEFKTKGFELPSEDWMKLATFNTENGWLAMDWTLVPGPIDSSDEDDDGLQIPKIEFGTPEREEKKEENKGDQESKPGEKSKE